MWEVSTSNDVFVLSGRKDAIQQLQASTIGYVAGTKDDEQNEELAVVPTCVCGLSCSIVVPAPWSFLCFLAGFFLFLSGLPSDVAAHGPGTRAIALRRNGENMGLVRYMLKYGSLDAQVKAILPELCVISKLRPTPWEEQKVGVQSRVPLI